MSVALPPPSTTVDPENVYQRVGVRAYLALLVHYLQPHKRRVAWLTLFVFGYTGVRLAAPQIVRFFTRRGKAEKSGL